MQYYGGEHKILSENRKNKLVCNHAKDISDTASVLFIGNPISYKSDTDIADLTDLLEAAGADEADGTMVWICPFTGDATNIFIPRKIKPSSP